MSEKILQLLALLAEQQILEAEVARQNTSFKAFEVHIEVAQHKNLEHGRYLDHKNLGRLMANRATDLEKAREKAGLNQQKISRLLIEINEEIPVPAERT